MKDKISITLSDKLLKEVDSLVDNIYIRNRSQAIEYLLKRSLKESKVAVILADNKNELGKLKDRFALKVNHMTIIERAIIKLADSGFRTIYIIADHDTLTHIFNIVGDGSDHAVKIEFITEEKPEGTAAALKLLKGKITNTFLVAQADLIFEDFNLLELWQQHIQSTSTATMMVCSDLVNKTKFGHVELSGTKVLAYTNKPDPRASSIFWGGVLVTEPEIFSYSGKSLEAEVFSELAQRRLLGGRMTDAKHLHIHSKDDLARVRKELNDKEKALY